MRNSCKILLGVLIILILTGCMQKGKFPQEQVISPEEPTKQMISPEEETNPKVSILYDNYGCDKSLKTSWGFSCLVEVGNKSVLFDTGGDSEILLGNMEKMGIDPGQIDVVVLSHIHGDHTGGLKGFLERNSNVTIYIPESFPDNFRQKIKSQGARFVDVSHARKITGPVYTTGELYGPPEEQSLVINSEKGLVVITGCAHPGIVNIVEKARELMERDVCLVVGGLHHPRLSVVKEFRELGVKKVAPSHCTGGPAREAFAEEYKENYIKSGVGKIIEI